jgi:hypothetical protein
MSTVKHQFVISSRELARWLDSQPGTCWHAAGDLLLLSKVHFFPCTNRKLADALRQIDKNITIYTDRMVDLEEGQQISAHELPLLADTQNRDFLSSWEGSDKEWLLTEDKWAAEEFADELDEWDVEGDASPGGL